MNLIDILLILLVLLSVVYGWRRGFLLGLLDLLGWGLVLVAALRYYQPVANWLGPRVDLWSEIWDQPLAFLFVAFASRRGLSSRRLRTASAITERHSRAKSQSHPWSLAGCR